MHDLDYRSRLEEQVDRVRWDNVRVPGSEYGESDDDLRGNESEGDSDDGGLGAYYERLW